MSPSSHIILVDNDVRRRAAIAHYFAGRDIHVEPFEAVAELADHRASQGLILVHDKDSTVRDVTEYLAQAGTWLPIVAFAETFSPRRIVEAILAGAVDYTTWPFDDDDLAATLGNAELRAQSVGSAKLREAVARSRIERLTGREREVLSGVAAGQSNRAIAELLAISPRTVEIHRANMLSKMGAQHTSEAIRIAIEASLMSDTWRQA